MPKQKFNYLESLPTIRIVLIDAAELYYAEHYSKEEFVINNPNSVSFDKHYKDLMPPNLDLIHLAELKKLTLGKVGDEYYTDDFVNVMFKYSLRVNEKGERVFKDEEADKEKGKDLKEIRKSFYLFGFIINGQKYVRYKRSAGSAKSGSCLFIKEQLYKQMNKWSQAGLNEDKDKNCLNNLTSYEAYKALSLSSLIHTKSFEFFIFVL